MPAFTNPSALNMLIPDYKVDQIIGIHTDSFGVSAPSAAQGYLTASKNFTTGFGDNCYFQGIFSVDGGSTWNDFGVNRPNLTTPAKPVLQTISCQGYVTTGGVFTAVAINWYDNVHSTSSAYTVNYKVVFFAKDTQGAITPIQTNEKLYYNAAYNFQKVFKSGSFANSGSNTVILHNLGYTPKVRGFFAPTSSTPILTPISISAGAMTTLDWWTVNVSLSTNIQVDSTNATFSPVYNQNSAVSGTVYYRIYYDS